jgi:hypothetical protein
LKPCFPFAPLVFAVFKRKTDHLQRLKCWNHCYTLTVLCPQIWRFPRHRLHLSRAVEARDTEEEATPGENSHGRKTLSIPSDLPREDNLVVNSQDYTPMHQRLYRHLFLLYRTLFPQNLDLHGQARESLFNRHHSLKVAEPPSPAPLHLTSPPGHTRISPMAFTSALYVRTKSPETRRSGHAGHAGQYFTLVALRDGPRTRVQLCIVLRAEVMRRLRLENNGDVLVAICQRT